MDINLREVTSSAVLEEKKKLRREFKYLDMIFYTVAALIGLDTIGAFAANGTQALTWLVISAITFLFPYALLTAELGSTFTQEGGMYEWCKMAGGRFFAAMAAMLNWVSNPLWLGGTLAVGAIAAIKLLWFGSLGFKFGGSATTDAIVEILIALFFVWGTIWCAILSLRIGKYISVFGSYLKLGLLVVFVLLAPLARGPAQTTPDIQQILQRLDRLENENRELREQVHQLQQQMRPAAETPARYRRTNLRNW